MRSSSQNQNFSNTGTATNNNTSTSSVGNTKDIENLRGWEGKIDPGLAYQYSRLSKGIDQGFNDPLGGSYAPQVRDAITRSSKAALGQQEAEAYRGGQQDVNNMTLGKLSALADLTAPRTVTSSGTSSGTQSGTGTMTQTPSWLQTGSQVAGAVASGFA